MLPPPTSRLFVRTSTVILRRECLEAVGLFDISLPPNEDYDLWSMGPDREDGTEDDITNWTRE